MGFAVTATHLVFAVALLSAGSFAAASYWTISSDLEEARRAEARLAEEIAHTQIMMVGTPAYNAGADRLTFDVKNTGSTVLKLSGFSFLVDGVYLNGNLAAGYPSVSGSSGTDLLLPGETMNVRIESVANQPVNLRVVAENGVSTYWSQ